MIIACEKSQGFLQAGEKKFPIQPEKKKFQIRERVWWLL